MADDSLSPLSSDEVGWHERCWDVWSLPLKVAGFLFWERSQRCMCLLLPNYDRQNAGNGVILNGSTPDWKHIAPSVSPTCTAWLQRRSV